jgi:hypothetical protein
MENPKYVMLMNWAGVTPEQYQEVRSRVNWEGVPATGGLFHIAAFDDNGLRVTDLWESPADFQRFADERLMPVIQQMGITTQPTVEFFPTTSVWSPVYKETK